MNIDVDVSLYPLRQKDLSEPIDRFLRRIEAAGLDIQRGPMSSRVRGGCGTVFKILSEAFEEGAKEGDAVLVMKVSNACPQREPEFNAKR